MNNYELTVILRISDSLEANKEKIKGVLAKFGANIVSEDIWGVKRLAYLIDREKDGHYIMFNLESPPLSVQKITNEFRLNTDILRFLFVRIENKKTA